jgi:hypothetical protein
MDLLDEVVALFLVSDIVGTVPLNILNNYECV